MTGTVDDFLALCQMHGSVFTYHRDQSLTPCPCRTPQGFRDDLWHRTDQPQGSAIDGGAGALSGTFTYRVHALYAQGEKYNPATITSPPVVNKRISISWTRAEIRPPSGSGSAIGYNVFRQSGTDWLLVAQINNASVTTLVDNSLDNMLPIVSPIRSVCNEAGFLVNPNQVTEIQAKGFIHPVQSGAVRRLTTEVMLEMFGEIQADDHLAIVPCVWQGVVLDFKSWGESLEDRITYNGQEYTVVSDNLIPDPADGNPFHHWEVGLRLIGD